MKTTFNVKMHKESNTKSAQQVVQRFEPIHLGDEKPASSILRHFDPTAMLYLIANVTVSTTTQPASTQELSASLEDQIAIILTVIASITAVDHIIGLALRL